MKKIQRGNYRRNGNVKISKLLVNSHAKQDNNGILVFLLTSKIRILAELSMVSGIIYTYTMDIGSWDP